MKKTMEFETASGKYASTAILGEGGAGRVYRVTDEAGNEYALKLLDPKRINAKLRKRFKNELRFGMQNSHPRIITITDFGLDSGSPFYVMPLYGQSLRGLIRVGIRADNIMKYFTQLLDGVEAAHLQNIVHRDLKPENILYDTPRDQLLVADFGIARFLEEELYTVVETGLSSRLANFRYAAPEQRTRGVAVDHRADIYALGCMLNEMCTGEIPQGTGYRTIAAVIPELRYLDELVDLMLRQSPADRPQSIDEIKSELIARGNQFVARQELNRLQNAVIPDTQIDDPLLADPIRPVSVDYQGEVLILKLSQRVTPAWLLAFKHIKEFTSLFGKGPDAFSFQGEIATIPAREEHVQRIVDDFKKWLSIATENYRQVLEKRRKEENRRQHDRLLAMRAEAERRKRVLEQVRI